MARNNQEELKTGLRLSKNLVKPHNHMVQESKEKREVLQNPQQENPYFYHLSIC